MVNPEALFAPKSFALQRARVLPRRISAIQLSTGYGGAGRLGAITQLPQSAPLEVCGDGFNERTIKVRCQDSYYWVFRDDVEILDRAASL